jgi:hypothetical protein
VNLDERLRRALERPPSGWPDETGAYDRFLRRRRRYLLRAGAATGLGLVLVVTLAAFGPRVLLERRPTVDLPPRPVPAPSLITRPSQGYQLPVPAGWQVDQRLTDENRRVGQDWLVLRPTHPASPADMLTVATMVLDPTQYPGRPHPRAGTPASFFPPGQTGTRLNGRLSEGRRRDGRAFALGDQGSLMTYMIAWPYRCGPGAFCPAAARLRALKVEAQVTRASRPVVAKLARALVEAVRPITNALPGGPAVPESPGLFAMPVVKVGAGGAGATAWELRAAKESSSTGGLWVEIRFPQGGIQESTYLRVERGRVLATANCVPRQATPKTAAVVYGLTPKGVVSVQVVQAGRAAVQVATMGQSKDLPYGFFVVAPLPLDTPVRAVVGLDAGGRQVARAARIDGVPGAVCHR